MTTKVKKQKKVEIDPRYSEFLEKKCARILYEKLKDPFEMFYKAMYEAGLIDEDASGSHSSFVSIVTQMASFSDKGKLKDYVFSDYYLHHNHMSIFGCETIVNLKQELVAELVNKLQEEIDSTKEITE